MRKLRESMGDRVCVCVREREKEREREISQEEMSKRESKGTRKKIDEGDREAIEID